MNHLSVESSPYLRQHATNPVDWYPWCDAAFDRALSEEKPVFLSIGYSSCHWCHVMAHESFEDAETAALLNRLFICVKVDREERPDVDALYMQAVQATTGRGGWPMSVWLTPDRKPFYAGTYFPDSDRSGMPAFARVCTEVARAWREQRDQVVGGAEALTRSLAEPLPLTDDGPPSHAIVAAAPEALHAQFDPDWGGFGSPPKFPPSSAISFLCREHARTGSARALEMVTTTLDAMAAGGIRDHLGGGFSRYSTDRYWLVPHFEKMLYDNALLTRAYLHGWMVTGDGSYRQIVEDTIAYVLRDLSLTDASGTRTGVFFSSQDADSEGAEGTYYLWDPDEVAEVCGADADAVIAHFGVTPGGNFEGRNILRTAGRSDTLPEAVLRSIPRLLARRSLRTPPGLDDKVLLSWNAFFLRALTEAGAAFARDDWIALARSGTRFLLDEMRRDDGRLLRTWHSRNEDAPGSGRARHLAVAEDYAALVETVLTLAEIDDPVWLDQARSIADDLMALFHDSDDGGFFATGADSEALPARPKDLQDGATPSASSMAANALLRIAALTGDRSYAAPAVDILRRLARHAEAHPGAFPYLLEAYERDAGPALEIAIVGEPTDARFEALRRVVIGRLVPGSVTISGRPGATSSPLFAGRGLVDGAAAAYVCEQGTCLTPVTDPGPLTAAIDEALRRGPPS